MVKGIQQLRGPNLTTYTPLEWKIVDILHTTYLISAFCSHDQARTFHWTKHLPTSSCPRSYWTTPSQLNLPKTSYCYLLSTIFVLWTYSKSSNFTFSWLHYSRIHEGKNPSFFIVKRVKLSLLICLNWTTDLEVYLSTKTNQHGLVTGDTIYIRVSWRFEF